MFQTEIIGGEPQHKKICAEIIDTNNGRYAIRVYNVENDEIIITKEYSCVNFERALLIFNKLIFENNYAYFKRQERYLIKSK